MLEAILATEISPELVPAGASGALQSTKAKIGPYELHDYFLHHIIRYGQAPSKLAFLALHAWSDVEKGLWPIDFPPAARHAYDLGTIRRWLEVFLGRFFALRQFKRSAIPNGPSLAFSAPYAIVLHNQRWLYPHAKRSLIDDQALRRLS